MMMGFRIFCLLSICFFAGCNRAISRRSSEEFSVVRQAPNETATPIQGIVKFISVFKNTCGTHDTLLRKTEVNEVSVELTEECTGLTSDVTKESRFTVDHQSAAAVKKQTPVPVLFLSEKDFENGNRLKTWCFDHTNLGLDMETLLRSDGTLEGRVIEASNSTVPALSSLPPSFQVTEGGPYHLTYTSVGLSTLLTIVAGPNNLHWTALNGSQETSYPLQNCYVNPLP